MFVGHKTEILSWAQTNGNSILGTKSTSQKMADVIFDRESTEMAQFLRSAGLEQYQQSLSLVGVVSLENLTSLSHEELEELAVEINMSGEDLQQLEIQIYIFKHGPTMPVGPFIPIPIVTKVDASDTSGAQVQQVLEEQDSVVGPNVNNVGTNVNNVGSNVNNVGPNINNDVGPNIVPMIPTSNVGPNESTMIPVSALSAHPLGAQTQIKRRLQRVCQTYKEVKLASYNHSNDVSASCMLDSKKSGSHAKIFRCRTVLSRKFHAEDMGPIPVCNYLLHWTKRKTGWHLNAEKSTLDHVPFCLSGERVTTFQLAADPEFVKHCTIEKHSTGKGAAKHALGGKRARIAGSVTDHTARRARLSIQRFNNKDYNDDWCKLAKWGRDWEHLNPRSRCIIKKDHDNM